MICASCAELADLDKQVDDGESMDHLYEDPPFPDELRCLYPQSCTCQHKPIGSYRG